MDEEFLVPREKILHPPSKAAMFTDQEVQDWASRYDISGPTGEIRRMMEDAATLAMAEERAAAEKMKAYLLRMGTRCGRLKAYLLRMGTRCGRLKAYLLRMGTRCGICPPGQRHEDCGDCERREIVAAYEKARGKEAGNG